MINNVTEEVNDKITTLRNTRYSYPQTVEEVKDMITSGMREMQLTAVSLCVLGIASSEDTSTFVDLDYTNLLAGVPIAFPREFGEHIEELQAAAQAGELQGTNDFLEILVPPNITDPGVREIYYSPWRKDLLRRKGYLHDEPDGSAVAVLDTALPNIEVLYYYPPSQDFPERSIQLKHDLDWST